MDDFRRLAIFSFTIFGLTIFFPRVVYLKCVRDFRTWFYNIGQFEVLTMPIIQAVDRAIRILELFEPRKCRAESDGNQARGLELAQKHGTLAF